jgi:hypothetical protein
MTNHTQLIIRLKQMPRQGSSAADALDAFNKALKDTFSTYQTGAGDLIRENVFDSLAKSAQKTYKEISVLEQRNRGLSESLKVNTTRAAQLSQAFDKMAVKIGANADKLKQYAGDLNKLIPGQTRFLTQGGKLGTAIAKQLDLMRTKLSLSDEQYQSLLKNQALFADKNESVTAGMNKFQSILTEAGNTYGKDFEAVEAAVTEAVAAMDSESAARFGKMSNKSFVEAVMGAKKLNIEMNKLLSIGDSFLDVESAIANELELQLLGAKALNVAEIQRAAYAGDANELQKQLTAFLEANGEQLKENPILLEKAAAAFSMQKSEMLDMYASLKLNNEAAKESGKIEQDNTKTLEDKLDIRSEDQKLQDAANVEYAKSLVEKFGTPAAMADHINKIADKAKEAQTAALAGASEIAAALSDSTFVTSMKALVTTYGTVKDAVTGLGSTEAATVSDSLGKQSKNDLFIPAGSGDTMISGPFGSFTMNPGDDILAAPNIRQSGGGTSAIIAALSKMSFHVTNVFDGDKIKSQLEIRQGQTLNNINNIA